ncbi:MAG: T9SS type A sorting domain-containing protein [Flavobacterium sp.]
MTKYYTLLVVFFIAAFAQAQTTVFDETLLTPASFGTFTAVSVTGNQTWNHNAQYGAVCSGFAGGFAGGQSYANEDWLISAPMNVAQMDNLKLTFSHTRGNAGVMNVGVSDGWYKVYATANYTGNTATTTWVEITGMNNTVATAWQYIFSGDLVIPAAAKSANTRIAFRYQCSAAQSATWEIKDVKVTGQQAGVATFKVTNWNTEWLGCTDFGPADEQQQLANVASAMLTMNSDIYCIQEVYNTTAVPTVASLVTLLGSSQWGGTIVSSTTADCHQRQAIIYKKSRVQLVSAAELNSGSSSQGNSYSYNWASGRFPSVYNVNLMTGSSLVPVTLVNIHAKAELDLASYTRRKGGAEALKTILDGSAYNTKNIILLGDFNDFLIGTNSTTACECTVSPFKNFMDDTAKYTGITQNMYDDHWNRPVIENFIMSNELVANYVAGSAVQEVNVTSTIPGFYNNTSNHTPITAQFQFSTAGLDIDYHENSWTVYPNPVKDELNITTTAGLTYTFATVYDITGRQVLNGKFTATFNVSALPAGVYILKIGDVSRKFVKE